MLAACMLSVMGESWRLHRISDSGCATVAGSVCIACRLSTAQATSRVSDCTFPADCAMRDCPLGYAAVRCDTIKNRCSAQRACASMALLCGTTIDADRTPSATHLVGCHIHRTAVAAGLPRQQIDRPVTETTHHAKLHLPCACKQHRHNFVMAAPAVHQTWPDGWQ
jgi:hypothetical protein